MPDAGPRTFGVVVPAYDPGPRLHDALASVIAQTTEDWSCLVLDDGGAEDLGWVDDLHPQVRRVRQANAGVSAARNRAAALLEAPLIAYLDQDDLWRPEKLEAQRAAMADGGDFSWTGFRWTWPDRSIDAPARSYDHEGFLRDGHICLSSLVVRRETLTLVGGFSGLLRVQQDFDLVLRLFAAGAVGRPVEQDLVVYRLHEENVSADYLTAYRERLVVLDLQAAHARRLGDARLLAAVQAGRRRAAAVYGGQAFDAFRQTRAPADLRRALRWNPRHAVVSLARAAVR